MDERITVVDPLHDERWDEFVLNHPLGWLCHLSDWGRVLKKGFKHLSRHYLAIMRDGNIQAGIPLYEVRSWLTGNRLVSVPFATLSDPLISREEDMKKLIVSALKLSDKVGARYIEIRTLHASSLIGKSDLKVMTNFKHHYLLLDGPPQELRRRFHRSCVRQRISRAVNSNIEITEGGSESDVWQLYRLYVMARKQIALPPQPYIYFKALWDVFHHSKRVVVLLARISGQYIAGLMLFRFKDRVSVEFAVADNSFRSMSPLHLLFWEAIRASCNEGFTIFDFGRTAPDNKNLMDFKSRWGTDSVDMPYFYCSSKNNSRRDQSLNYQIIRNLCRVAPGPVFQSLGNFVYRHMS